ncbi:MAG TPA: YbjN domain-containing protein [Sphingomicrobium sp.]|nr:YbjN domain-containing protein [Sphingomicrobium sp.]
MRTPILAVAIGLLGASPALAQQVTAKDPQSIARALLASGYQAEIKKDGEGDPMIMSASSGTRFGVFFYNCTNHANCATVQFHAGFDTDPGKAPSLEKINAWNRTQRFGRAYLDNEGDPVIEMDIDLDDGGMSQALFLDNLEFWVSVLAQFEKEIGW